jgi:purine nucleoside phosphorylase
MLDLFDKIQEAKAAIQKVWNRQPHAGIILGTGLGPLVQEIREEASLDYSEIPHFLKSTATSHVFINTRVTISRISRFPCESCGRWEPNCWSFQTPAEA